MPLNWRLLSRGKFYLPSILFEFFRPTMGRGEKESLSRLTVDSIWTMEANLNDDGDNDSRRILRRLWDTRGQVIFDRLRVDYCLANTHLFWRIGQKVQFGKDTYLLGSNKVRERERESESSFNFITTNSVVYFSGLEEESILDRVKSLSSSSSSPCCNQLFDQLNLHANTQVGYV